MAIDAHAVASLRSLGCSWVEVARALDVTSRQLEWFRTSTDFVDPVTAIPETPDGDAFLRQIVVAYLRDNGRRGERYTAAYVRHSGYHVSRRRLRNCIWNVDPEGRLARRPGPRIPRVVYEVDYYMELVHLDGAFVGSHLACNSVWDAHRLPLPPFLQLLLLPLPETT